jgi:hypothetical protein
MNIPRAIEKVAAWTETEYSRYTLNGVRIRRQAGKCVAEATDGRRLVLLEWKEQGPDLDVIVDGNDLAKACKTVPKKQPVPMGDKPKEVATFGTAEVPRLRGEWPQTETVLGEDKAGPVSQVFTVKRLKELAGLVHLKVGEQTVILSSKFVRDLADAATAVGSEELRIRVTDPLSQVTCDCEANGVGMKAVLMPIEAD